MNIFHRVFTDVILMSGVLLAGVAIARPLSAPHTGMCSFNGAQERCVVELDTDGSLSVTYLSDGKRVFYDVPGGKVWDGNRSYNSYVSNRGSYYIFTTENGQTIIPLK